MKLLDLYKQYGIKSLIVRTFNKLVRPVYKVTEVIVFFIPNHRKKEIDNSVKIMTSDKVNNWLKYNFIDESEAEKFLKFLNSECIGYYIEVENELAAWGFVQINGNYQYEKYEYKLPCRVHMLKNLFVKSKFRGMSFGKLINEARINGMPDSYIPCGFVIPENKYAIRNLKKYGFQEIYMISHTCWFKKYTKTRFEILQNNKLNDILIKGFNTL